MERESASSTPEGKNIFSQDLRNRKYVLEAEPTRGKIFHRTVLTVVGGKVPCSSFGVITGRCCERQSGNVTSTVISSLRPNAPWMYSNAIMDKINMLFTETYDSLLLSSTQFAGRGGLMTNSRVNISLLVLSQSTQQTISLGISHLRWIYRILRAQPLIPSTSPFECSLLNRPLKQYLPVETAAQRLCKSHNLPMQLHIFPPLCPPHTKHGMNVARTPQYQPHHGDLRRE